MELVFSPEQQQLQAAVRSFLDRNSSEADVRRAMATSEGHDLAVWAQLGGLGLHGLIVPERFGGAGGSFVELLVVFEEMGRALFCSPYFATVALATPLLLAARDEGAMQDYLPALAAGSMIATVALVEDSGRWDESGVQLAAVNHADGTWRLSGTKHYVVDGTTAELVLVVARSQAGVSLFAVDGSADGMTRTAVPTLDQTRKQACITFADTPARLCGIEGEGWTAVSAMLDQAAVALSAEEVGGAQRVLEMAVGYAKLRVQFGRPIGSYQAIKHKCADMLVDIESARSAVYYAGWRAAADDPELPVLASIAKAVCSEAYFHAAAENIQIHGGIGFTWEHSAHLYYRRAKSSEFMLGDPTYHRELVVRRIGV